MTKADRIGQEAADGAEDSSQGKCLLYVRAAIQRALGLAQKPIGVESAKDAGPWLKSVGFETKVASDYKNGDVMIINSDAKHPHGHIQVHYNGRWYSDFQQNTANPWTGCTVKAVYKYVE